MLGCMRDPLRTRYKMMDANTFHEWSQGFLMLRNGYFHQMVKDATDWEFYLGDLYTKSLLYKERQGEPHREAAV